MRSDTRGIPAGALTFAHGVGRIAATLPAVESRLRQCHETAAEADNSVQDS